MFCVPDLPRRLGRVLRRWARPRVVTPCPRGRVGALAGVTETLLMVPAESPRVRSARCRHEVAALVSRGVVLGAEDAPLSG